MENCSEFQVIRLLHDTPSTKICKAVQTDNLFAVCRRLSLTNNTDLMSTPPSELKKEIFSLRNELNEAHEFHDLELQVLMEENLLSNGNHNVDEKVILDLEKSLRDAENTLMDANRDISNLKMVNQELNKKIEEDKNKYLISTQKFTEEISKLETILRKQKFEIQNLEKDKADNEFKVELICKNYNNKIEELKSFLENKNEKESERNWTVEGLEQNLVQENEKTKELSKKLEDLNLELLESQEKIRKLENTIKEGIIIGKSDYYETGDEGNHYKSNAFLKNSCLIDFSYQENDVDAREEEVNTVNSKKLEQAREELEAANRKIEEQREEIERLKNHKEEFRHHVLPKRSPSCDIYEIAQTVDGLNLSIQNQIKVKISSELEVELKELKLLNEALHEDNHLIMDELKGVNRDIEDLKVGFECESKFSDALWRSKFEEIQKQNDFLSNVLLEKHENLRTALTELQETRERLKEREVEVDSSLREKENCIEVLKNEKIELQNWITAKEKEFNDLNCLVEEELIKFKIDSEKAIDELKEFYELKIETLSNDNASLYDEIENIKNSYDSELIKLLNHLKAEKMKSDSGLSINEIKTEKLHESVDLENDISENNSSVEVKTEAADLTLKEGSMSLLEKKNENFNSYVQTSQYIIGDVNSARPLSLFPVRKIDLELEVAMHNYVIHTFDYETMQLKINSDFSLEEFINEFWKVLINACAIDIEELKVCGNVFYSLLNKYLILAEQYNQLEIDFNEHRLREQKERHEFYNRTVNYLDKLCSEVDASNSSLQLSNTSFTSFRNGLPSSTILNDVSEVEMTLINDGTLTAVDPLANSCQVTIPTPLKKNNEADPFKTPVNTTRNIATPLKSVLKSGKKQVPRTPSSVKFKKDCLTKEYSDLVDVTEDKDQTLQTSALKEINLHESNVLSRSSIDVTNKSISTEMEKLVASLAEAESCLNLKVLLIEKMTAELEEASQERAKQQAILTEFQKKVEELQSDRMKLEALTEKMEKYKEDDKLKDAEIESLNEKLTACENDLKSNIERIDALSKELKEVKLLRINDEEAMSALKSKISECEVDKIKFEEMKSELEKYVENDKTARNVSEALRINLTNRDIALNEKMELVRKLEEEVKLAKIAKTVDEECIAELKAKIKEFEELNVVKMELIQNQFEQYREKEKIMNENTGELRLKLQDLERSLTEKVELIDRMDSDIKYLKESKAMDEETISKMKRQMEMLEQEQERLEVMEAEVKLLEETKKAMRDEIDSLKGQLSATEANLKTKMEVLDRIYDEWGGESERDEIVTVLKRQMEQFKTNEMKFALLECELHKCKESEKLKDVEIDNLNAKLATTEKELTVKLEDLQQMTCRLDEAEGMKNKGEEIISGLNEEIAGLKNDLLKMGSLQGLLEIAQNEKVASIDNLNSKVKEFEKSGKILSAEVEVLQGKLNEAEESLKSQTEKLNHLKEMENELVKSKEMIEDLRIENKNLKNLKNQLIEVSGELSLMRRQNKEFEERNAVLKGKVDRYEELNAASTKEIESLKDEIMRSGRFFNDYKAENSRIVEELASIKENYVEREKIITSLKTEVDNLKALQQVRVGFCEDLEKEKQELEERIKTQEVEKEEMRSVLQVIQRRLNIKDDTGSGHTIVNELDKLAELHKQELKKLQVELITLKKANDDFKIQIEDLTRQVREEDHLQTGFTPQKLRTGFPSKRNRFIDSPSFISRRLEKLENLNDLLSCTINKIFAALNIPVPDNLFSVGQYEAFENQIMRHISSLKFIKRDNVDGSRTEVKDEYDARNVISREVSEIDLSPEKFQELEGKVAELDDTLLKIIRHIGLPEGVRSSQEVINQINKNLEDLKKGYLERIDILNLDNQHLDDDNNLLQQEMKKLIEEANANRAKLSHFEKSEKMLKNEMNALKAELSELKNGKVAEDNSIRELMSALEKVNREKSNLEFRIKELEDLLDESKKQVEELDEECESYAKVIKEAKKETVTVWEEGKLEIQTLKAEIGKLKGDKERLQSENDNLMKKIQESEINQNRLPEPDIEACHQLEVFTKEIQELKGKILAREMKILELEQVQEKIHSHKSQIKYFENSLLQARKQFLEEKEKNQKLQTQLEQYLSSHSNLKISGENEMLERIRLRSSPSSVNHAEDREKLTKLEKDNKMLKELCRARHNEIKRLEIENASLKGNDKSTKNSNQMDSPIRTRIVIPRSKKF